MKCIIKFFIITVILLLITISFGQGRVIYDKNKSTAFIDPYSNLCVTHQDINKMKITLQNNGIIGFIDPILEQVYDCLSGENVSMGSEYPQGSRLSLFRYIGLSVGAVLGTDTLVSHIIGEGFFHNTEFLPENSERGNFSKYSILNTEDKDIAISEQDIITTYEDTTVYWGWDAISGKYHKSLNIEVTQKCYGWSYNYA